MAVANVAVAITKAVSWHGQQESFDNVYYFDGPPVAGSPVGTFTDLIDQLVAAEKPVYSDLVTFLTGRVWSVGGTAVENVTLAIKDLTGVGTGGAGVDIFREAAVNVEWACDRLSIKGRKVYLRKYIRPGTTIGLLGSASSAGAGPLEATARTRFKAYADKVQSVGAGTGLEPFLLCSPKGRTPASASNGVVNDFMVSREFRRN